jgi:uncharacterized delta-60 repeat protein
MKPKRLNRLKPPCPLLGLYALCVLLLLPLTLSAQGENWVYRYNGPGNGDDRAYDIVYGADSNIYAAGYCLGSGTNNDILMISLTPAGDSNWVYRYNGPGNDWDELDAVVYGADGNIYAAGYSMGSGTGYDFMVISLTPAGDTNWVYRYNGPGNDFDWANSIAYGADNNIYAAGLSYGGGSNADFIVISLTTVGDTNWVYRYDGPGGSDDYARAIIYGPDGDIYAAGSINYDFAVISLTPAGDTNWLFNDPTVGGNAHSIIYGADNNIYVAGGATDFMVLSLATTGDTNWTYRYNGMGNLDDCAYSLVNGPDGNIYAAGYSKGSSSLMDFTVISLTPAGDTSWVYRYIGAGNGNDGAESIVFGADGNIYAAGYSLYGSTGEDIIVISLTPAGDTNCVYRYNGPGNSFDHAFSIINGADGNTYVAGFSRGIGTASDFTVISLPPDLGIQERSNNCKSVKHHDLGATIINGPL